jgi:hypothetical protein
MAMTARRTGQVFPTLRQVYAPMASYRGMARQSDAEIFQNVYSIFPIVICFQNRQK